MAPKLSLGRIDGAERQVEVDAFPDACPHCHYAGQQIIMQSERVIVGQLYLMPRLLYLATKCPRQACGRPSYAVYEEPKFDHRFLNDQYRLKSQTPWTPAKCQRDSTIVDISPDFYEILDQAAAADAYGLPLVAGAGFRKALEYLVKDYVLIDLRQRLKDATEKGDGALAASTQAEIDQVLELPLGGKNGVIARIDDAKLQKVAERAAWLGNDEVHYTRRWTDKDIEDLKVVLNLVLSIIRNNASYEALLEDMP